MKILDNLDLNGNQLQNAKIEVTSAVLNPGLGRVYVKNATNGKAELIVQLSTTSHDVVLTGNNLPTGSASSTKLATLDNSSGVLQLPSAAIKDPSVLLANEKNNLIPLTDVNGKISENFIKSLDLLPVPTGMVSMNGHRLTGLPQPTADSDAATRGFVIESIQGIRDKFNVTVATVGSENFSLNPTNSAQLILPLHATIDGRSITTGDKILVKNFTAITGDLTKARNGLYDVIAGNILTRMLNADQNYELAGAFVFVEEGATNADTGWLCTNNNVEAYVLNLTAVHWVQFSAAGQIVAKNILGDVHGKRAGIYAEKVGTELQFKTLVSADTDYLNITTTPDRVVFDLDIAAIRNGIDYGSAPYATMKRFTLAAGAAGVTKNPSSSGSSFDIAHGFGRQCNIVVKEAEGVEEVVYPTIQQAASPGGSARILFGMSVADNAYKVIVYGCPNNAWNS